MVGSPSRGKSWYLAKVGGSCSAQEGRWLVSHVNGIGQ